MITLNLAVQDNLFAGRPVSTVQVTQDIDAPVPASRTEALRIATQIAELLESSDNVHSISGMEIFWDLEGEDTSLSLTFRIEQSHTTVGQIPLRWLEGTMEHVATQIKKVCVSAC